MIVYNKITWSSKNKGDNNCENCPRAKLVGDGKITGPQGIFLQQQKHSHTIVILKKLVTYNSNFEKNSDTQ